MHECVSSGGKVLIPVFALGRAQELCLLLDSYWERMNLSAPIYFSAGMAEKVYTVHTHDAEHISSFIRIHFTA